MTQDNPLLVDEPDVVRRIERAAADDEVAIADVMTRLDPDAPAASRPWAGGHLVTLGPGAYVNRGLAVALDRTVSDDDVAEAESFFAAHGLPLELEVCPAADPSLLRALSRRGLQIQWFRQVLARRVLPADADADAAAAADLRMVDDGLLAQWLGVFRMLTDGDEDGITISDRYAAAAHGAPGATDVLAYVDGTVAGAASVIVRDGRAALGGAVTLPAFRRRGLHAALIQWRLRQAARSGCDLATAAADVGSASARNLQRQGFVVAYTVCCVRVQSSTT